MPWTAKSAHGHTKKANTPAKKKKWAKIAEGLRKKGMEEGRAIRIANAAVGDRFWDGDFFLRSKFNDWLDRRTQRYNRAGQSEGYWDDPDEEEKLSDTKPGEGGKEVIKPIMRRRKSGKTSKLTKSLLAGDQDEEMEDQDEEMEDQAEELEDVQSSPCPSCGGSGFLNNADGLGGLTTCPNCNGTGNDPITEIVRRTETHHESGSPVDARSVEDVMKDAEAKEALYKCSECEAKGFIQGKKCPACGGAGFIPESERMRRETAVPKAGGGFNKKDSDYRPPFRHAVYDREFSTEQRKSAAESGAAMKGGGYPIHNKSDLSNARQALGRAKNRAATVAHIKKRARALGVKLPEGWPNDAQSVGDSRFQLPQPLARIIG